MGVRERLLEAVRVRLRADVPVGVFLSGGIDSSIVAGMVKHLMKEKGEQSGNVEQLENIHCYSIGFDGGGGFDESGQYNRFTLHCMLLSKLLVLTFESKISPDGQPRHLVYSSTRHQSLNKSSQTILRQLHGTASRLSLI